MCLVGDAGTSVSLSIVDAQSTTPRRLDLTRRSLPQPPIKQARVLHRLSEALWGLGSRWERPVP